MKLKYTATKNFEIQNARGTSDLSCICGSWIDHWRGYSNIKKPICAVIDCDEEAEDGAHITRPIAKDERYKTHLYIVPMCRSHNLMHGEIFSVKVGTIFVWANKSKTCES